jgi:Right handed beta helix region
MQLMVLTNRQTGRFRLRNLPRPHWKICIGMMLMAISLAGQASAPPAECQRARAVTSVSQLEQATGPVRIVKPLSIVTPISTNPLADLCFISNGRLDIADGVSVSLGGRIFAGPWRIFTYGGESAEVIAPEVQSALVEWWGAVPGDNFNDTTALRHASKFISTRGSGELVFQRGTYIVGQQYPLNPGAFQLGRHPVVAISGTTGPVILTGNGAKLVAEAGLYFGYFDPVTGVPAAPSSGCGAGSPYAANAYTMINLEDNADVTVRDFELDGNIFQLVIGAACPDGRQLFGYGLRLYNNDAALIENVYTHHHPLDGLIIGYDGISESDPARPHVVRNVVSEYNARQGLSWVGGNSLIVQNSKFNHTGRAVFSSPPGAGMDIEAEDAVIRNGIIEDSEFINNTGPGLVADSGDGGYTTVRRSTMWGTTSWSLLVRKPGMVFEDCTVYGSVPNLYSTTDPDLGTRFTRCHFEDLAYGTHGVFRSSGLLELNSHNLVIEDSTIKAHDTRALYLDGTNTREYLRDVVVTHGDPDRPHLDFQSLIRGSSLENVTFREEFDTPPVPGRFWFVQVDSPPSNPNVVWSNVCVDGPLVRWLLVTVIQTTGCPVPPPPY